MSDAILPIASHRQVEVTGDFDAIFVGSGISSLTAAATMSKLGKRVLVLEQHYTAGGYTHVFTRKGYEWDVGVHYVGGVTHPKAMLATVFQHITDGALEWADMGEVYDRVIFGDETFDFVKGPDAWRDKMVGYFPEEADAIDQYLDLVKGAAGSTLGFFAEKAFPPGTAGGGDFRAPFLHHSRRTTGEVLAELTDDQRLIGVLAAQYGDYGMPPGQSSFSIHAMVVNHYLHGGAYPVGGSGRIVETIADVIAQAGGQILVKANVEEIVVVRDGDTDRATGVRLDDGTVFSAPTIVSGAGVFTTWEQMLSDELRDRHGYTAHLETVAPSAAHLCLYLGFAEGPEALGMKKPNLWIYPDGKYDHDANIAAFLADPEADFPLVYVSYPAAKDPSWSERHPDRSTIDVITLAPWEWFAKWSDSKWKRRGEDYDAFKQSLTDRLLEVLFRYEPQLRGKVDHAELSTPLSTRDFVNYAHGEIYGIGHDPERFDQEWLRPHTPIEGLWMTGQDIATAGIGGALVSGLLTLSAMYGRDEISRVHQEVHG